MTERELLAARLLQDYDAACDELAVLTRPQREALQLAAKGYGYQASAELLRTGPAGIKKRLYNATTRLGCSMPEAIALAAKAGLV